MTITKKQAKEIALDKMMEAVGEAYYKICDSDEYTADEGIAIMTEINKLGERIAKALKTEYITY